MFHQIIRSGRYAVLILLFLLLMRPAVVLAQSPASGSQPTITSAYYVIDGMNLNFTVTGTNFVAGSGGQGNGDAIKTDLFGLRQVAGGVPSTPWVSHFGMGDAGPSDVTFDG